MSDEIKQSVKEEVRKIFSSPTVQKAVLDIVDNRRPKGWSSRSYPTYYKEIYAKQIREDIDAMIANYERGEITTIVMDYDAWCGEKDPKTGERPKMAEYTLYLRVNQSIRFLTEHLDTEDRRYGKWNQVVDIRRNKQAGGITISWSDAFLEGTVSAAAKARHVQPEQARPKWERQIDYYLTDETNYEPLIIPNLLLTQEEVIALKKRFVTLTNVMADISGSCIRLLKMKES